MQQNESGHAAFWEPEEPLPPNPGTAEAETLVKLLSSGGQYVRTGILLLPSEWLGREGEVAARLGISHVNYAGWKAAQLPAPQSFLLLSADRLLGELDELCLESHPHTTLLVSLLDLPLTRLHPAERSKFWQFFCGGFSKRPRALLLALPEAATLALPAEAEGWQTEGRLAAWSL
ncbi:hypothetical protein [Deinococcus humi]|uniref:Uncharacterized protein n=1 Tax=Deinococcus humi TaxID=662880 RepID=A0A7W8NGN9_9DEIO|nr:hypothetical protein [Deinococcus humi]MBB5365716.1 hypothetical protein [Deinococcus humi]GGO38479.1 hypothetical protein GCM10008949_45100 [Deinococcus humi]